MKIKLEYRNKLYIHMKIIINFNIHEQTFIFRIWKNEFLSHLINDEYYHVFKMLFHHSEFFCFTWNYWVNLSHKIAELLRKVIRYIMFWYFRSWKYSSSYSNELKIFNWLTQIQKYLFQNKKISLNIQILWMSQNTLILSKKLLQNL